MPLAEGIGRDIVESVCDSVSAVKASRNPCVDLRSWPNSGSTPRACGGVRFPRSNRQSGDVMSLASYTEESRINPLDVVERLATGNDWSFERASDDEITILVTGRWTDYQLSYTWMGDIEALHLACAFDLRVPERRHAEVQALISLINERLWVGHFDHWVNEGIVMFRHALVLAGGTEASGKQCEALLGTALEACERYFSLSNSWSGPAKAPARRSMPPCSKLRARHKATIGDMMSP